MFFVTVLFAILALSTAQQRVGGRQATTNTDSGECVDSPKFQWLNKQNNVMDCEDLAGVEDKLIAKELKRRWCPIEVTGHSYMDKSKAFIRDKCVQSCDNCCVDVCVDSEEFIWQHGDETRRCAFLTSNNSAAQNEKRQKELCDIFVDDLSASDDVEDKSTKIKSKCPVACNNCCETETDEL